MGRYAPLLVPLFPVGLASYHEAARAWEEGRDFPVAPHPFGLWPVLSYSVFHVEALEREAPEAWGEEGRVWGRGGVRLADLPADPEALGGFLEGMAREVFRRRHPASHTLIRAAEEMAAGAAEGFWRAFGPRGRGWDRRVPVLEAAYRRRGDRVRLLAVACWRIPPPGEADSLTAPPGWQRLALLLEDPARRRAAIRAAIRESRARLPAEWDSWLPPGVLLAPGRSGGWWAWEPGSGLAEDLS